MMRVDLLVLDSRNFLKTRQKNTADTTLRDGLLQIVSLLGGGKILNTVPYLSSWAVPN